MTASKSSLMPKPAEDFSQPQSTSIQKAFYLLEHLAASGEPRTLGEIAEACSLTKPSTVRLLKILQTLGYADRPKNSRHYCVGPKVAQLAQADPNAILKNQTRPLLERIHQQINETVNLGVISGQRVAYVDYIETTRPLRMIVAPGSDDLWFRTALGRAIASQLPPDEQARLLANSEIADNRSRTRNLAAKLAKFKKQSYAEELEETVEGVGCVAVSLSPLGYNHAAISVSVPLQRLAPNQKKQILQQLFAATRAETLKR